MFGLSGWRNALLYLGLGLAIAILAGWVIGRLTMEAYLEKLELLLGAGLEPAGADAHYRGAFSSERGLHPHADFIVLALGDAADHAVGRAERTVLHLFMLVRERDIDVLHRRVRDTGVEIGVLEAGAQVL